MSLSTFGLVMKQNFSLPSTIIYYIAMNPSTPEAYKKLVQSCKFFFKRNPILVADIITHKEICSDGESDGHEKCCIKFDVKKITTKIWLTRLLHLDQNIVPNFAALLRPKIYLCDIYYLCIKGGKVGFDDLKIFVLFAKEIHLEKTQIVNNNGSSVMLENILEALGPNVKRFTCYIGNNESMVSASTVKNISKLKIPGNLKTLFFSNIPQAFCLDDIFTLMKAHNDIIFLLHFAGSISEHYKIQVDQLVDSLIETQLSKCYITYPGQNQETRKTLRMVAFKGK